MKVFNLFTIQIRLLLNGSIYFDTDIFILNYNLLISYYFLIDSNIVTPLIKNKKLVSSTILPLVPLINYQEPLHALLT